MSTYSHTQATNDFRGGLLVAHELICRALEEIGATEDDRVGIQILGYLNSAIAQPTPPELVRPQYDVQHVLRAKSTDPDKWPPNRHDNK